MLRIRDFQTQRHMFMPKESLLSLRDKEHISSVRDSISSLRSVGNEKEIRNKPNCGSLIRKDQSVSSGNLPHEKDLLLRNDRQRTTSTRGCVAEIEETVTISRRTSINGVPASIGMKLLKMLS